MGHRTVCKRSHHPEHNFIGRKGVGGQVQHQRRQRPGQRRNSDACKDQRQRRSTRPRQHQPQNNPNHRPRQCGQRQSKGKTGRQPRLNGQHRPQRGRAGHTNQPRIRQRVAQITLHCRPGQTKPTTDHQRQQRARQADFAHHKGKRSRIAPHQCPQTFKQPDIRRTGRKGRNKQRPDQNCQNQHQAHHGSAFCISWRSATISSMARNTKGVPQTQSLSVIAASGCLRRRVLITG